MNYFSDNNKYLQLQISLFPQNHFFLQFQKCFLVNNSLRFRNLLFKIFYKYSDYQKTVEQQDNMKQSSRVAHVVYQHETKKFQKNIFSYGLLNILQCKILSRGGGLNFFLSRTGGSGQPFPPNYWQKCITYLSPSYQQDKNDVLSKQRLEKCLQILILTFNQIDETKCLTIYITQIIFAFLYTVSVTPV